jgi:hypothetical protein
MSQHLFRVREVEMAVVALIVMESGSEWPGHVGDSEDVVALGYDGEGLLEKTRRKLESLRRQGQNVRVAVLACNQEGDPSSVSRRAEVANELLASVSATGFGKLVLTASKRVSMRQRCELLSLAGELSQSQRGATSGVSVRFGEGARRELGLAGGIGGEALAHAFRYCT